MIEQALEGKLRLPEVVAQRRPPRARRGPFAVEPEVTIDNQWSDRYTVIEVSGLDRPGLLYELTTAISKLNLNIASAHVATFGETRPSTCSTSPTCSARRSTRRRGRPRSRARCSTCSPTKRAWRSPRPDASGNGSYSATPSCFSSQRLRSSPPPYLTSAPLAPISR